MSGFYRYKTCFPEVWDKMSQRVPGANTALLYARTELYGFGGAMPPKPEDLTWEQFIVSYVQQFAPQDTPLVAENVRRVIQEHYSKTRDPILSEVDHPLTGISWKRVLNIAMRGDFKGRRTHTMTTHSAHGRAVGLSAEEEIKSEDRHWERYNEARQKEGL